MRLSRNLLHKFLSIEKSDFAQQAYQVADSQDLKRRAGSCGAENDNGARIAGTRLMNFLANSGMVTGPVDVKGSGEHPASSD